MSKKQLLNESEVRRFMRLANLEPLSESFLEESPMGSGQSAPPADEKQYELEEEAYGEDSMEEPEGEPGDSEPSAEGDDKQARFMEAVSTLAELADIDIEMEKSSDDEVELEPEEEEEEEEPSDEEPGDEEESPSDEEGGEDELDEAAAQELQEHLVDNILNRVTARLHKEMQEAKKKNGKLLKSAKNEKQSVAARMAAMRAKKSGSKNDKAAKDEKKPAAKGNKLAEANAAAPKSTHSNGPKKGAGSATKGAWGVNGKVADQKWKEGKDGAGGHELESVTASSKNTNSHGKQNLAVKGSVK